jgi:hypothetical protein
VAGPSFFIADWAVLGARAANYSPVHEAISELARLHAPTRPAMTVGFLVLSAAMPTYALALRDPLPGNAWKFAAAYGVTTLGVAAFPLGTPTSGDIHGVFAGLAYASLAAVPIAAAGALRRRGRHALARASLATGLACGAVLVASVLGPAKGHGLLQRVGLTIGDAWLIGSALGLLRAPAVPGAARDPSG